MEQIAWDDLRMPEREMLTKALQGNIVVKKDRFPVLTSESLKNGGLLAFLGEADGMMTYTLTIAGRTLVAAAQPPASDPEAARTTEDWQRIEADYRSMAVRLHGIAEKHKLNTAPWSNVDETIEHEFDRLQTENARLHAVIAADDPNGYSELLDTLDGQIKALERELATTRQRLADAEAALRPFAEVWKAFLAETHTYDTLEAFIAGRCDPEAVQNCYYDAYKALYRGQAAGQQQPGQGAGEGESPKNEVVGYTGNSPVGRICMADEGKHFEAMAMGLSDLKPSEAYAAMGGDKAAEAIVARIEQPGFEFIKAEWLTNKTSFEKASKLLDRTIDLFPDLKSYVDDMSGNAWAYTAMSVWELALRHAGMWPEKK